ncbi:type IX secretion system membrane protein PorP/SprF [Mucilaginibacter sp. HMF5004]|uniref:PorP/SprF family type IX secretion system membrane protein n=1 Tax=Mucilaginibacter rivuli TaxID=2857527 RepID=UPI001C5EB419|nr:type IX secretion system membrane protein PorP/SprF [Mucilaginibacter rivuli]MBW4891701.1 type IX secretion system membrane protein PorP/SprF [Mucilaginibacter rivuli]
MKRILAFGVLFFLLQSAKAQQDAQFSQYVFNGIYLNPAYAGYKQDLQLHSFCRSQWTGLTGAPLTYAGAADVAVLDGAVGLGLMVNHDQLGAQSYTSGYANASYRIQFGRGDDKSWLSFGLGFGMLQTGLDGTKLNATQSGDMNIPTTFQSTSLPDARIGVLYTTDNFFAGFSVDNLLAQYMHPPATSESLMLVVPKPHKYLTVGALFSLNDDTKIKPSIMIKEAQGAPTSIDVNTFVLMSEKFWIGGTFRTGLDAFKNNLQSGLRSSSALVGMVEFYLGPDFRIGYAYDYSLNKLGSYGYGSHEISLDIVFKSSKRDYYISRHCYF